MDAIRTHCLAISLMRLASLFVWVVAPGCGGSGDVEVAPEPQPQGAGTCTDPVVVSEFPFEGDFDLNTAIDVFSDPDQECAGESLGLGIAGPTQVFAFRGPPNGDYEIRVEPSFAGRLVVLNDEAGVEAAALVEKGGRPTDFPLVAGDVDIDAGGSLIVRLPLGRDGSATAYVTATEDTNAGTFRVEAKRTDCPPDTPAAECTICINRVDDVVAGAFMAAFSGLSSRSVDDGGVCKPSLSEVVFTRAGSGQGRVEADQDVNLAVGLSDPCEEQPFVGCVGDRFPNYPVTGGAPGEFFVLGGAANPDESDKDIPFILSGDPSAKPAITLRWGGLDFVDWMSCKEVPNIGPNFVGVVRADAFENAPEQPGLPEAGCDLDASDYQQFAVRAGYTLPFGADGVDMRVGLRAFGAAALVSRTGDCGDCPRLVSVLPPGEWMTIPDGDEAGVIQVRPAGVEAPSIEYRPWLDGPGGPGVDSDVELWDLPSGRSSVQVNLDFDSGPIVTVDAPPVDGQDVAGLGQNQAGGVIRVPVSPDRPSAEVRVRVSEPGVALMVDEDPISETIDIGNFTPTQAVPLQPGDNTIPMGDVDQNRRRYVVLFSKDEGEATVDFYPQRPAPDCESLVATVSGVTGTEGNDVIIGTPGPDVIRGLGGDDIICGLGGNDEIEGGNGDDTIDGGSGADVINAGNGRDSVFAGADVDTVIGGEGNDFIDGGPGSDTLTGNGGFDEIAGGAGTDDLSGGDGDDLLRGGEGTDIIRGGIGDDNLFGEGGQDTLLGEDGSDNLFGGPGNDVLVGGGDDDLLDGGGGNDVAEYSGAGQGVQVSLTAGTGIGHGNDSLVNIEDLSGSPFDDVLSGDGGPNAIAGEDGRDTIRGLGGDDQLFGGADDDSVDGGAGADSIDGGPDTDDCTNGEDVINCEGGDDPSCGGLLAARAELEAQGFTFFVGTPGDDTLTGTIGKDVLIGLGGNDILLGGGGDDILCGGPGDDSIDGQVGNDTAYYADAPSAVDADLTRGTATAREGGGGIGTDTFTAIENVRGSAFDDLLVGDAGVNLLEGGPGGDTLDGRGGDDVVFGALLGDPLLASDAGDIIEGGDGNDLVEGGPGVDFLSGGPGNDLVRGGPGGDTIDGGVGNDNLAGDSVEGLSDAEITDAGDDTIQGGPGTDNISGDGGNDTISGGAGNDIINGDDGRDTIWGYYNPADPDRPVGPPATDDDTMQGSRGNDVLHGGPGNDAISGDMQCFSCPEPDVPTDDNRCDGADTLIGDEGDDSLSGDLGNDIVDGGPGFDSLNGGAGDDTLTGGDGDDLLYGWGRAQPLRCGTDGEDDLDGGDGDDFLDGGPGADGLLGGDGNDDIEGGAGDTIDAGAGDDCIDGNLASINFGDGGPGCDGCYRLETQTGCEDTFPAEVTTCPFPAGQINDSESCYF